MILYNAILGYFGLSLKLPVIVLGDILCISSTKLSSFGRSFTFTCNIKYKAITVPFDKMLKVLDCKIAENKEKKSFCPDPRSFENNVIGSETQNHPIAS